MSLVMSALVAGLAQDASVLNCFSYSGAFSVYAFGGGAKKVISLDSSKPALELAGQNLSLNGFEKAGGEILNSTYFSIDSSYERDGHLTKLTLRGGGYGHGVGMCQWGAIGRARAGQTFREILATYYPGTSVGPIR